MTKRRSIAFFINYFDSFTGGPRVVYNFVRMIDTSRFRPVVLTNKRSPLTDSLEQAGIAFHVIEQDPSIDEGQKRVMDRGPLAKIGGAWKVYQYNNKISRVLKDESVDLLWVRNTKGVLLSGFAATRLRIPLIWDIGMEKTSKGMVGYLHNISFWLAKKVVTESESVARSIFSQRQVKTNEEKLVVVRSGIPSDRVIEIESEKGAAKKSSERFNIINIASICDRKNQKMAIQSILPLIESHPEILVTFVGPVVEQEYFDELNKTISEAGAEKNFEFLGWRDDATKLLVSSDLFLLCSKVEGVPYSVLESMHAKIPVVATACGGVPAVIVDGETGYLIQIDDVESMTNGVQSLLSNSKKRSQMANSAYEFVLQNHTAENWCATYMDLMDSLINGSCK